MPRAKAEALRATEIRDRIEDLEREYDRIDKMVQETGEQLESDGIVVEREVGTVNNRHMALVENELLGPYKKLVDMQAATAKTIERLRKIADEQPEEDEFDAF